MHMHLRRQSGMASTSILPTVQANRLPSWATYTLVGGHPPCLDTWTCQRCPNRPQWPCVFARDHGAEVAQETPAAGLVWHRWCYLSAAAVLPERPDILRARMVGWYQLLVDRVDAYQGNRGWWRRWRHWPGQPGAGRPHIPPGVAGRHSPRGWPA
jgi:hypothetical protein